MTRKGSKVATGFFIQRVEDDLSALEIGKTLAKDTFDKNIILVGAPAWIM